MYGVLEKGNGMNWTKEKPTESGWYWIFATPYGEEIKDIAEIAVGESGITILFPVSGYEWEPSYEVEDVIYWMGPLPEPPNPTED